MNFYGFHLLDFTPNAMTTMAIFVHLCENFVGVMPNVDLFRHYFVPRVESKVNLSGETTPMGSLRSLLRLAVAGLCKERVW